jgi:surface polysaccharide O-acyltransferase-like enzyme
MKVSAFSDAGHIKLQTQDPIGSKSGSGELANKIRNSNIDLLRIVAMLMIVIWHLIGHGGVLGAYNNSPLEQNLTLIVKSLCLVAVNCYVLISGYFLTGSTFRVKKLFNLIVQVIFYSLSIYTILVISGLISLTEFGYIQAVFPVFGGLYWFVSAYVGMYLLSPFINRFILSINQKVHLSILTLLIGIFSIWPFVLLFIKGTASSKLILFDGYNIVWFIVLYFIASYIRLYYVPKFKIGHYLRRYLLAAGIVSTLFVGAHYVTNIIPDVRVTTIFNNLSNYNSLTALIPSLLLFIVFLNLRINNTVVNKLISVLSPLTFGVYLIHDEPHIRKLLWGYLDLPSQINNSYFALYCIFVVAIIYIACSLIDWCRGEVAEYGISKSTCSG